MSKIVLATTVATRDPKTHTPSGTRRRLDLDVAGATGLGSEACFFDTRDTQARRDESETHTRQAEGSTTVDNVRTQSPKRSQFEIRSDAKNKTSSSSSVKTQADRTQLWSYLLQNMTRAVDEVYFLCELECGKPEIDGTVTLLEQSARDFKQLARTIENQNQVKRFGLKSIVWDVGRTELRPSELSLEIIQKVVGRSETRVESDGATKTSGDGNAKSVRLSQKAKQTKRDGKSGSPSSDGWRTAGRRGKPKEGPTVPVERGRDERSGDEAKKKSGGRNRRRRDARDRRELQSGSDEVGIQKVPSVSTATASRVPGKPPRPVRDAGGSRDVPKTKTTGVSATHGSMGSLRSTGSAASSERSLWSDMSDGEDELPPLEGYAIKPDATENTERDVLHSEKTATTTTTTQRNAWGVPRDWGSILSNETSEKILSAKSRHHTDFFDLNRKHAAHLETLHLKLMSPDRKKKTPGETASCLLDRQKRATELRLKAEEERVFRMKSLRGDLSRSVPTTERLRETAVRVASHKAAALVDRQKRAEETRLARIELVVKKASLETRKVETISKTTSVEIANKQETITKKLADAEKRRASLVETRLKAAEALGLAARAAEERRFSEETRKRLFLEQRVREKEQRRACIALEAQAREAAVMEKRTTESVEKRDVREKRSLLLKLENDLRRDETRKRMLAADARRVEYLNLVRERAVGSSTPGRAEKEKEGIATPTGCPASPSRVRCAAGGIEGAFTPGVMESPSRPTRVDAGEALERRVATVRDRHRAMRKRAKKLRQRLAACAAPVAWRKAGDCEDDDVLTLSRDATKESTNKDDEKVVVEKSWAVLPNFATAAHARLRKLAVAIARRDPPACASAHREVRVALAEAGAAAAAAGAEEHSDNGLAPGAAAASAALAAAVTSGLCRALAEALRECLAASAQGGGFLASPNAAVTCVSLALALDAATAGSPLAAESLLVENLAAPLIPHLVAGLGLVGDPAAAETATPGAGGGVPPPTAALEPLLAVVARVVRGAQFGAQFGDGTARGSSPTPCARSTHMRDDFVELLVVAGVVDALASLFALCDRPKERGSAPIPPAIVCGLRLLESLLDARAPGFVAEPTSGVANAPTLPPVHHDESPAGSLLGALKATALAGLPSLLTSVLLQTENETRVPVLQDGQNLAKHLPANFVSVATAIFRLLNLVTRFGSNAVQQALSSSDLRVETHHLVSVVLGLCGVELGKAGGVGATDGSNGSGGDETKTGNAARWEKKHLRELLDETLLFTGHFALQCRENQDMLSWGMKPTLVQRLVRIFQSPRSED